MSKTLLTRAAMTVILTAWAGAACVAQSPQPARLPQAPAQPIAQAVDVRGYAAPVPAVAAPAVPPAANPRVRPGYVYLNAPLYTAPRQNIPIQVGSTYITNQAFAPHEMLYAHDYKAIYPPYAYKVRGHWMWTPWGMYSHDEWKLQGTEVNVKYRSHIPKFAGFSRPIFRFGNKSW